MSIDYLHSERVYLRPFELDDVPLLHTWFNDSEVTHYMFAGQKPTTLKQVQEIMERDISGHNVVMMAIEKETNQLFALVGLYEIHDTAIKAEMRIIIGNKEFWGKGYGKELTELITFYGFDRLNLHRIYLGFTSANKAAEGAYTKAGYVYEGTLKDDIYRNSQYYDSIRMALLRDEYYEKYYEKHKVKFSIGA